MMIGSYVLDMLIWPTTSTSCYCGNNVNKLWCQAQHQGQHLLSPFKASTARPFGLSQLILVGLRPICPLDRIISQPLIWKAACLACKGLWWLKDNIMCEGLRDTLSGEFLVEFITLELVNTWAAPAALDRLHLLAWHSLLRGQVFQGCSNFLDSRTCSGSHLMQFLLPFFKNKHREF